MQQLVCFYLIIYLILNIRKNKSEKQRSGCKKLECNFVFFFWECKTRQKRISQKCSRQKYLIQKINEKNSSITANGKLYFQNSNPENGTVFENVFYDHISQHFPEKKKMNEAHF